MSSRTDDFFSPCYGSARDRFRAASRGAGARVESLELAATGPDGERLTIDVARLGAEQPERVLLHISGVHGVEGFVGSAIQARLLADPPPLDDGVALIAVHAVNPYGMAHRRRVNENNVDLNRNFLAAGEPYRGAPDLYRRVERRLNPTNPPSGQVLSYFWVGWCLLRYGLPVLKRAVMGGQYDYPRGIFFGGHRLEPGSRLLLDYLKRELSAAGSVAVIDVHSGQGEFGEDALWVSCGTNTERFEALRRRLGPRVTERTYPIRGELLEALEREIEGPGWCCLVQEFGVRGPLRVVRALLEENRWFHHGRETHADHPAAYRLLGAFCPHSESWRRAALRRGVELVRRMLAT